MLALQEISRLSRSPRISRAELELLEHALDQIVQKNPYSILLGPLLDSYIEASQSLSNASKIINQAP